LTKRRSKTYEVKYEEAIMVTPKNKKQEQYMNMLNDLSKSYVFATGPAGVGKTLLAVEKGIQFFNQKIFKKIIITRPAVSVDENHGFLPGNLQEKMDPWIRPLMDVFKQHYSPTQLEYMMKVEKIEISPLAYMRGRTFKDSWIIADEMQNATPNQLKMLLTRIGDNSKMVITGDTSQHDHKNTINGMSDFLNKYNDLNESSSFISTVNFSKSDVERHAAIEDILSIYGDL
jgi:phosphate starvation-inducible PhoH-like protein